jgi:hypothetical protein
MAKFSSASTQDGGTDLWRTLAATAGRVKMHVIKAYAVGDSYATAVTTNSCGSVDMVPSDFVQSGAVGAARATAVAAKSFSVTASSGAAPNLHIAIVDSTNSVVLFVTDETSDQVLTLGNTFNCPTWNYSVGQPV